MKMHLDDADKPLVAQIAARAERLASLTKEPYPALAAAMDLAVTHLNGCPLQLEPLLNAGDVEFSHDVFGIHKHLDRSTGALDGKDNWRPKFEKKPSNSPRREPAPKALPRKRPAGKKPAPKPKASPSARAAAREVAKPAENPVQLQMLGGTAPTGFYKIIARGTGVFGNGWSEDFEAPNLNTAIRALEDAVKAFRNATGFAAAELYEACDPQALHFIARAMVDRDPGVRVSFDDK